MQTAHGSLRLDVATSVGAVLPHLPAWQQLATEAEVGDWFCSPLWLLPWFEHFAAQTPCCVLFGYEADQLVGVLPLLGPIPAAPGEGSLRSPVNVETRRVGLMMRRSGHVFASKAVAEAIRRAPNGCVTLERIPNGSRVDAAIDDCVQQLCLGQYATEEISSAVSDLRAGWSAYLASRDGKLLRNLRARERKMTQDGQWERVDIEEAHELPAFWEAVLDIEQASWKQDAHSALTDEPTVASFYRTVLEQATAEGALRCHLLRQAGVNVAYAAGVELRGTYFLLKNSYRASHRSWAPGSQLVWQTMQCSAERGVHTFDFLGDVSPWKRDLATDIPSYTSRTVYTRSNIGGRLRGWMEMQLKPAVRKSVLWQRMRRGVHNPEPA